MRVLEMPFSLPITLMEVHAMTLVTIAALLLQPQLDMAEVEHGAQAAARGQSLTKALEPFRRGLGKWFDGIAFRSPEQSLALTPKVVSRWLGWQRAKEGHPSHWIDEAWDAYLRDRVNGLVLLLRLVAFPKMSFFDLTDESPADPKDLQNLSFKVVQSGIGVEILETHFQYVQRHSMDEVLGDRWLSLAEPVALSKISTAMHAYDVGGYHARYTRLRVKTTSWNGTIEVVVSGNRSQRRAMLNLQ